MLDPQALRLLAMARPDQRLATNASGSFYVDRSCINCGTCWQFDQQHFAPTGSSSHVCSQPLGEAEQHQALLALLACPVAAIGCSPELLKHLPSDGFPTAVLDHPGGRVHYCGWSSRRSFGASSWLIERPSGNVMIDSPRWSAPLAKRIRTLGGISAIVLTHRDDVADHEHWARAFGCPRWIHKADADKAPEAEKQLEGGDPRAIGDDLVLIPTPGHTAGSMVLLLGQSRQVLFSGDHLWWNPDLQVVVASRRYCWWNWAEQLRSVERLIDLDVAWLLPGHGHRHAFATGEWAAALRQTLCHAGVIPTEPAAKEADPAASCWCSSKT